MGWLSCCPGIVWEPVWKQTHMQLVREHSATVISAHWVTLDWSWHKEWNWCARTNLHLKKKKEKGKKKCRWMVEHSPKILASEEKATTPDTILNGIGQPDCLSLLTWFHNVAWDCCRRHVYWPPQVQSICSSWWRAGFAASPWQLATWCWELRT